VEVAIIVAVGVGEGPFVAVAVGVGEGPFVAVAVAVGDGPAVGVAVGGVGSLIFKQLENSEVLPLGSLAVALTPLPGDTLPVRSTSKAA